MILKAGRRTRDYSTRHTNLIKSRKGMLYRDKHFYIELKDDVADYNAARR